MIQKIRGSDEKGFTLIELMIVIAIIGILAAIAIPNFVTYRQRGYDAAANADIKNAFTAAQAYFTDNETGTVTEEELKKYGYTKSKGVVLNPSGTAANNLKITAYHKSGTKVYSINAEGEIEFKPRADGS